eukprot:SAG31_NODE_146_length_22601_cov_56.529192_12_plen_52_part_00
MKKLEAEQAENMDLRLEIKALKTELADAKARIVALEAQNLEAATLLHDGCK